MSEDLLDKPNMLPDSGRLENFCEKTLGSVLPKLVVSRDVIVGSLVSILVTALFGSAPPKLVSVSYGNRFPTLLALPLGILRPKLVAV